MCIAAHFNEFSASRVLVLSLEKDFYKEFLMMFSKVSFAAVFVSTFALSAFASSTKPMLSSSCEAITIAPQAGLVDVYASKDSSELNDSKAPFTLTGILQNGRSDIKVSDLKIEILKQTKVDSFQKSSYGWGVSTTDVTVYGVKLRVSADYVIGFEIQGDVGVPVSSIETYAICYDRATYVGQPKF
jgi:hypothetical protein